MELKLYKLQLECTQKEILRAGDIIEAIQRNKAEAEPARARTKTRRLQEEKLVILARGEGRRMGYREGLSINRGIGYDEGRGISNIIVERLVSPPRSRTYAALTDTPSARVRRAVRT